MIIHGSFKFVETAVVFIHVLTNKHTQHVRRQFCKQDRIAWSVSFKHLYNAMWRMFKISLFLPYVNLQNDLVLLAGGMSDQKKKKNLCKIKSRKSNNVHPHKGPRRNYCMCYFLIYLPCAAICD